MDYVALLCIVLPVVIALLIVVLVVLNHRKNKKEEEKKAIEARMLKFDFIVARLQEAGLKDELTPDTQLSYKALTWLVGVLVFEYQQALYGSSDPKQSTIKFLLLQLPPD